MVDLTKDRDPCPKCSKMLDIGIEHHGIEQCLRFAAEVAGAVALPLPWHVHSVYKDDPFWIVCWRNGSSDQTLKYAISEIQYQKVTFPVWMLLEGFLRNVMEMMTDG